MSHATDFVNVTTNDKEYVNVTTLKDHVTVTSNTTDHINMTNCSDHVSVTTNATDCISVLTISSSSLNYWSLFEILPKVDDHCI